MVSIPKESSLLSGINSLVSFIVYGAYNLNLPNKKIKLFWIIYINSGRFYISACLGGVITPSAAPAVRYPNVYGIDMPAAHELIAHNRTEKEIGSAIGADKMIYQDLAGAAEAK
jgi:hypothetical protein